MPITVYWETIAPNIIRWDFYDPWTLEEFWQAYYQSHDMVRDHDGLVDFLLNGNQTKPPAFPLAEFQRAFREASPKQNTMVIINENSFIRSLMQVLQRLRVRNTDKLYFARSIEEAHAVILGKRLRA